jgi:hypothetical protein
MNVVVNERHKGCREDPDVSSTTPQLDGDTRADSDEGSSESVIRRVLSWLTAGYPKGVPPTERYALIALLNRTLTADEVQQVINALTAEQSPALEDGVISDEEIRDMITKVIEDAPSESDLRKVSSRLAAAGWPLEGTLEKAE